MGCVANEEAGPGYYSGYVIFWHLCQQLLWHALRANMAFLGSDPKNGIRSSISPVTAPLDDLEEETLAIIGTIELEILAVFIAVIENIGRFQPVGQIGIKPETRFDVIIVIRRDFQRRKAVGI